VAIEQVLEDRWQMPVQIVYGMTETAGIIAARRAGTVFPRGWLGPAVDGTELRVVSDQRDSGSVVDPLVRGHVLAKGVTIGPGYTIAELNKDLFTADGWLITGDLGMLDGDGNLCLSGRAKDIIIRGGHNIDASTIEEAAMSSADVEAAAAVPAPDNYAGEVPYLYVTAKPGCLIDPYALREMLKGRLEGPAVPKHVEVLGQLPLTGAGKVYKPALVMLATRKILQSALHARAIPDDCWTIEERAGRLVVTTDAGYRDVIEAVLDTMSLELG
jgi:fatty-acyl-CoA synthase